MSFRSDKDHEIRTHSVPKTEKNGNFLSIFTPDCDITAGHISGERMLHSKISSNGKVLLDIFKTLIFLIY